MGVKSGERNEYRKAHVHVLIEDAENHWKAIGCDGKPEDVRIMAWVGIDPPQGTRGSIDRKHEAVIAHGRESLITEREVPEAIPVYDQARDQALHVFVHVELV